MFHPEGTLGKKKIGTGVTHTHTFSVPKRITGKSVDGASKDLQRCDKIPEQHQQKQHENSWLYCQFI